MIHEVDLKKAAYHWTRCNGTYVCGYIFLNDIMYTDVNFAEYIDSHEDVISVINEANGNFAIVKSYGGSLFACCDAIRSYPLFYTVLYDKLILSDSAEPLIRLSGARLNPLFAKEYLAAGFVSGQNTLYNGIYNVQAGEYLLAESEINKPITRSYYLYDTVILSKMTEEELISQLDHVVNRAFDRLVRTLHGKQVVVPLSGGFDSRLVVQMLHKNGVSNVVCFSYGGRKSSECVYSKQIADSLGYCWIYVDLALSKWRDIFNSPQAEKYWHNYDYISAIPYIQHYAAMSILLDGDFGIEKDCIVITGNSGDFLEGKNIHNDIFRQETYSRDEVCRLVASQHEILAGRKPLTDPKILSAIALSIPDGEKFTADEAARIAEYFNWRERQSKYVVADSRAYEALGVTWRLPLWDKELMRFWEAVPPKKRSERLLYYKYIQNEKIGNANELTSFQKITQFCKKHLPNLFNIVVIYKRIGEYYSHPFRWYGIVSFGSYMKSVLKTGGASGFSICTIVARELYSYYKIDGKNNG